MIYKITHTTTYIYSELIPVCQNQVHLTPRDSAWQQTQFHRLQIVPSPSQTIRRADYFGNHEHFFAVEDAHRKLVITATSRVNLEAAPVPDAAATLPWEKVNAQLDESIEPHELPIVQFRYDSPHAVVTDEVREYAIASFPPGRPVLEGAVDLMNRIHADFAYDSDATDVHTTVEQVLELRRGVCQDFAHLQIACLRSLGLAARYVSGYLRTIPPEGSRRLVGADASHAWVSLYCGVEDGWIDLDPTNAAIPSLDHITVAWGRDYSDVCPIKGIVTGAGPHTMTVAVDVMPLSGDGAG